MFLDTYYIDEDTLLNSIDIDTGVIEKKYIKDNYVYIQVNDKVTFNNQNGLGIYTIKMNLLDICENLNIPDIEVTDIKDTQLWLNAFDSNNIDLTLDEATVLFNDSFIELKLNKKSIIDITNLFDTLTELNNLKYADNYTNIFTKNEDTISLELNYINKINIFINLGIDSTGEYYYICESELNEDSDELYNSDEYDITNFSELLDKLIYELSIQKRIIDKYEDEIILNYIDTVINILNRHK